MLLYQVMESRQEVSDRYYRTLYTKLSDVDLKHSKGQVKIFQTVGFYINMFFLGHVSQCIVQVTEM